MAQEHINDVANIAAQLAVQTLIFEHWRRIDRISDEPAEALHGPHASMQIGTLHCDGAEQIAAYFSGRREQENRDGRRTRHAITNIIVTPQTPDIASACFSAVVYAGIGQPPFATTHPATVADFTATCHRQDDGSWLFQTLQAAIFATGAGAAPHAR